MYKELLVRIGLIGSCWLSSSLNAADALSHRVNNCEVEIEMLKNNLQSQEESRAQLYKDMETSLSSMKKVMKEIESQASEPKQKMQKAIQGFEADLLSMKAHVNQLSTKIQESNSTLSQLKKEVAAHNASLKSIEEAIALLSKAISPSSTKETPKAVSKDGTYIIQPGDSLEKVARKYGMTVKELKELNHLSSSVIRVGQELKVNRSE